MSQDERESTGRENLVELNIQAPIWDSFFTLAPIVLVGTRENNGKDDIAPKHMAFPMGWQNFFGFICTPRHGTYQNIKRDKAFAVTYPKPSQWLETSLTASPRCDDGEKPSIEFVDVARSPKVDCPIVREGYLYLECQLERLVDGFGPNSLIVGRVVAARVDAEYLRSVERDDYDLIHDAPLLGYVSPGRFVVVDDTRSFPFPAGMKK